MLLEVVVAMAASQYDSIVAVAAVHAKNKLEVVFNGFSSVVLMRNIAHVGYDLQNTFGKHMSRAMYVDSSRRSASLGTHNYENQGP